MIKPRERDTIIQALRAGVVPKIGLQHVQVGHAREVEQMIKDVDRIVTGGSTIRFVVGEYGAGKTFFLNLVRLIGLERKLVVVHADLTPDRRLHATGGQARMLYAELMRNMATRTRQEGGALSSVVERFIGAAAKQARTEQQAVEDVIHAQLASLEELVAGFDIATVLSRYWQAYEEGDEGTKAAALRWLRGEYGTRTEARQALGVRTIIDDASVYDHLKLMARFVTLAGYAGLLVVLDEMVNLYKLQSAQARSANYEQLLRILNDVLQGSAEHMGFLMGGTPEFLLDTRRGLYSYPALQSRLAENRFARDGLVDLSGPVMCLQNLTPEDLFVLLANLRKVFAAGNAEKYLVPDEALHAFMRHCSKKIGDAYFRTPRNTVMAFVDLLAVLEQNPGVQWQKLLDGVEIIPDQPEQLPAVVSNEASSSADEYEDELTSFRL